MQWCFLSPTYSPNLEQDCRWSRAYVTYLPPAPLRLQLNRRLCNRLQRVIYELSGPIYDSCLDSKQLIPSLLLYSQEQIIKLDKKSFGIL